jgi:uncharacterized protein (DUF952 family)
MNKRTVNLSLVVLMTSILFTPALANTKLAEAKTKAEDIIKIEETTAMYTSKYPYIFHLIQKEAWEKALANNTTYYPPTYEQDDFTHATANPEFLLIIGNHFYKGVKGDWLCLRMSANTLKGSGVNTIFEGTAPVGDKQPDFPGTDSELFPHILGGINPSAVIQAHTVSRSADGTFLAVSDIIEGE